MNFFLSFGPFSRRCQVLKYQCGPQAMAQCAPQGYFLGMVERSLWLMIVLQPGWGYIRSVMEQEGKIFTGGKIIGQRVWWNHDRVCQKFYKFDSVIRSIGYIRKGKQIKLSSGGPMWIKFISDGIESLRLYACAWVECFHTCLEFSCCIEGLKCGWLIRMSIYLSLSLCTAVYVYI